MVRALFEGRRLLPSVVVSPYPGNPSVGPGLWINWSSDFIGPLGTGSYVHIDFISLTGGEFLFHSYHHLTDTPGGDFQLMVPTSEQTPNVWSPPAQLGSVQLASTLYDGTSTVATGTLTTTWDGTTGLGRQAVAIAEAAALQAGLTADQQAQATATYDNTLAIQEGITAEVTDSHGTTAMTMGELFTGYQVTDFGLLEVTSGPSIGPIEYAAGVFYSTIIVRLVDIPDGFPPITPDDDYRLRDLGVVTVYRGGDPWIRRPIHGSTCVVRLTDIWQSSPITPLIMVLGLLDVSFRVDLAEGVTAQVYRLSPP